MWSRSPLLSQGGDLGVVLPWLFLEITVFFESNLSSKPEATTPGPSSHRRGEYLTRIISEKRNKITWKNGDHV